MIRRKMVLAILPCALLVFAAACGGGSSSSSSGGGGGSTTQNTLAVSVNSGISTQFAYTNGVFVSVTVCQPGSTSNCTTVPNVLLDTGSTGLRLLSGTVSGLGLATVTSGGQTLTNCVQYLDNSYDWGPVATADIQLAGERASSVPIQIIAEPNDVFPAAPSSCGGTAINTTDLFGANGVLGVSFYQQDCGSACAPGTSSNGGSYYSCSTTACSLTTASLSQQLQNPVGLFSTDNNGLILTLPSIASSGAISASGSLKFGVDTQSDNALGSAFVLLPNAYGNFSTTFKSVTSNVGFLDSGSSALFFLTNATTGLPGCTTYTGFYCPSTTQSLTATNTGSNGATSTVSFGVGNADSLLLSNNDVFSDLAGTGDDTTNNPPFTYFDWGLPFFLGRSVFVVLEDKTANSVSGPYWAY
jgi:hypothetical protein